MFRLIINALAAMRIYYVPPLRLSEKSRRELESLYPTTGETTNFQSSEGVLLLLRQSPLYMGVIGAIACFRTLLIGIK